MVITKGSSNGLSLQFRANSIANLKIDDAEVLSVPGDIDTIAGSIETIQLGKLFKNNQSDADKLEQRLIRLLSVNGLKTVTLSDDSRYTMVDGAIYRLDYTPVYQSDDIPGTNPIYLVACSPDATSIAIPSTVTTIGTDAFANCKNLISVSFPEGLKTYSYTGTNISFVSATGSAIDTTDLTNFQGRTYAAKEGVEGLALCPVLTFVADGTEVAKVTYTWDGKASIPEVPAKTNYIGVWEDYSGVTADRVVNAVYTSYVTVEDGKATVELPSGVTEFEVPESATTVSVSIAENTSITVSDASGLAGKTVVSNVESKANTSDIAGSAYELTFTVDGAQYDGKLQVTLPYTKEDGKEPVVYYRDGSVITKMDILSVGEDHLVFETDHNSEYIVAMESEEDDDDDSALILGIVVAVIVILLIAGILVYRSRKA